MWSGRKLVATLAITAVLFVGSFGVSFFAMKIAFASPDAEATHGSGPAPAHAGQHFDPSKYFKFLGSPGDHYGKDAVGGPYGDGVMIDPDTKQPIVDEHGHPVEDQMSAPFLFMVLNFVLLLALLSWKGKPAIEKLAADRHDQIKTALDEAAKLRKQAADKLAEFESKLKQADGEIAALVAGMRADAEADKKRILAAAEAQAAQMKRDAEHHIAAEIEAARTLLTREVTAAAATATERILRETMTATDQHNAVGAFITGIQTAAKEAR